MSHIAALSEDEIEERFCITVRQAVCLVLNGLIAAQERIAVHVVATGEQFLTILLAVDAQQMIVNYSVTSLFASTNA